MIPAEPADVQSPVNGSLRNLRRIFSPLLAQVGVRIPCVYGLTQPAAAHSLRACGAPLYRGAAGAGAQAYFPANFEGCGVGEERLNGLTVLRLSPMPWEAISHGGMNADRRREERA